MLRNLRRVTRSLTAEWTAQQLREATPYGEQPKYLIRDNDKKFGATVRRVAAGSFACDGSSAGIARSKRRRKGNCRESGSRGPSLTRSPLRTRRNYR
jgi:hypothetical protein